MYLKCTKDNHRGLTLYGRVCHIFYQLVRLFVWGLSFYSRIFQSYGDGTITVEGLRILTFARQSWPLSVPDLLWHGASLYNDYVRRSMALRPIAERLYNKQLSCQYLFLRFRSVAAGIRTFNLSLRGNALTHSANAAVFYHLCILSLVNSGFALLIHSLKCL